MSSDAAKAGRGSGAPKRALNQDDLFGASKRAKLIEIVDKKKKKKDSGKTSSPLPSLGLGLVKTSNKTIKIEPLVNAKYLPGCLALGVVLSVSGVYATVSLPGGCIGTLSHREVSDVIHKQLAEGQTDLPTLSQLLQPQQIVRVCVTSAAEDKKISLSSRASLINRGMALKHLFEGQLIAACIVSKEDHGFVMSGGISGVNFFLRHKNIGEYHVGQALECLIKDINLDSRTVTLKLFTPKSKEEPMRNATIPFLAISPGMRFELLVDKKVDNGLLVSYLSLFHGAVDAHSMAKEYSAEEWKNLEGLSSLHARVVFVDHSNKVVRLSLKPHIMELRAPTGLPALGSTIENLSVISVNSKAGIVAKTSSGEDDAESELVVLISKRQLDSKSPAELEEQEKKDTKKNKTNAIQEYEVGDALESVRITGYHLVEGLCAGSNLRSTLSSSVTHYSHIIVGEHYDAEVTGIKDFGLTVRVADKISAVCPKLHCGDVVVEGKLTKKFKVGQVLRMRAWETEKGAIILTNKKTLVELEGDGYVDSFDVAVGAKAVGVVSHITDKGISVRFFNKIQGELAMSVLTKQGVLDPSESYRVGQIVKTAVIHKTVSKKVDEDQKEFVRIFLALDMHLTAESIAELKALVDKKAEAGTEALVSGTVSAVSASSLDVRLDDGRAAVLEKNNTFEFVSTADELFGTFAAGQRITNALIVGRKNGVPVISLKPLLLRAAAADASENMKLATAVSDLSPGDLVAGVIVKVESFGVKVRLGERMYALAARPSLADRFVSSPVGLFTVGDSMRCVVQRVDLQKEKVFVTFKPSAVPRETADCVFLRTLLKEKYLVAQHLAAASKKLLPAWEKHRLGSVCSCQVASVEDYGVVMFADDQTTVFVDKTSDKRKVKVGESVKVQVLDVDLRSSVIEVKILDKAAQKKLKTKFAPSADNVFEATIELVKDKYLVVSKNDFVGLVAIADYHNPQPEMLDFQVGASLKVKLWNQPETGDAASFPHEQVTILQVQEEKKNVQVEDEKKEESDSAVPNVYRRNGRVASWVIESIYPTEMKLVPAADQPLEHVQGIVHITTAFRDDKANDNLEKTLEAFPSREDRTGIHSKHPFHAFSVGQKIDCQVLQVQKEIRDEVEHYSVHLGLHKKNQEDVPQLIGLKEISAPALYHAVVTKVDTASCTVAISPFFAMQLPLVEVSKNSELLETFQEKCYVGLRLSLATLSLVKEENKLHNVKLSRAAVEDLILAAGKKNLQDLGDIESAVARYGAVEEGEVVSGVLNLTQRKVPRPPALAVSLRGNKFGRLCVTEIVDTEDWSDLSEALKNGNFPNGLVHGSVVQCRVLSVSDNSIEVSLRDSRISCKKLKDAIKTDPLPTEGQISKAFVTSVSEKGCFVRLSRTATGRVMLRDLSDSFLMDPATAFPVGKLVEGRVQNVDHLRGMVQLNLKPSVVVGNVQAKQEIKRIREGAKVVGTVERVNEIGVFVRIKDTSLVGLARKATALDDSSRALAEVYSVGDVVQARVLRVSENSMKIALGLSSTYFKGVDEEEENKEEEGEGEEAEEEVDEEEEGEDEEESGEEEGEGEQMDVDSDDEGEEVEVEQKVTTTADSKKRKLPESDDVDITKRLTKKRQAVSTDDDELGELAWDEGKQVTRDAEDSADSDSDDESADEGEQKTKLRTRQKEAEKKRKEKELRDRERALAEGNLIPQTSDDFERLLIAQPNSSFLWIHYIAHHLNSADVEAARSIANRALKTIHFREEEEKFNVWMALLNMEFKFGTKDSLEKVFSQAIAESKTKQIFLSLANTYEEAGDKAGATAVFERALKKPQLKKSKKVWIAYHAFKLRSGEIKAAKDLLARSLQSLSRHKHIEVISKYALAEFDVGSADRGRVLFEELLVNYPKRSDLWHLYVDKEVKMGNVAQARQLFERMIAGKSSTRNMKTIFKKFLAFESQHGTEETQEAVKQKAREYVSSLA